jgi:quercetin dioxygenase-like cupin family protein
MTMEHIAKDARPGRPGSADWFSGDVSMVPLVEAAAPAALRAAMVHFAPGARTHWHTHPLGQMIHIVAGKGRAQREGGSVIALSPGDTVWFPPGERHWHGAAPDCAMSHLAVQEALDGVSVTWAEPVADLLAE